MVASSHRGEAVLASERVCVGVVAEGRLGQQLGQDAGDGGVVEQLGEHARVAVAHDVVCRPLIERLGSARQAWGVGGWGLTPLSGASDWA